MNTQRFPTRPRRENSIPRTSAYRQLRPGGPTTSLVRSRSYSREVVRDTNDPATARAAVSTHNQPVLPDPKPPQHRAPRDHLDRLAPLLLIAGAGCQWLIRLEWALVLLALAPMLLILWGRGRPKAFIYAGIASVALAAVDLGRPVALAGSTALLLAEPHRAVSLLILGLVVFRLGKAYVGLRELSRRDPLTGLLNRRGFDELAARELERGARYGRPIAFALIDIDRFKEINDRFGHSHGDRVLRSVGAQLANLRVSDLAVRLGGDEFGLLMPETDEAAAERVVARLKERVQERMRASGWSVTISVGTAAAKGGSAEPIAALIAEADRRMYANKPHRKQAQR
jgi:diguanylate cyclase (GGDEF)-like protein